MTKEKKKKEEKIIDERETMRYDGTIILASGTIVDTYEVSPGVYRFIFRREDKKDKKNKKYRLVPR